MRKNIPAFTLVELIVVITIVGILSTVGFVSYSGYLTGARDSNRFSQLTKLSDSLQVYATTKSLPLPDDYVEVTATGVVLGYQGYAGTDVLETIDYTNGGKDPKDDTFFTYNVSKNRKYFQFTTFLEQSSSTAVLPTSYAIDYSERYVKSYGKSLGIYTDENNTPIQEISTVTSDGFLDIFNTSDIYTVHFGDGELLSGDSTVLRGAIGGGGLVGYWSFESLNGNGTSFLDKSINNITGIITGGVSIDGDGVIGNSVNFDGVNGSFHTEVIKRIGSNGASPHTISTWVNVGSIDTCGNNNCRQWPLVLGNFDSSDYHSTGAGSNHWLIGGLQNGIRFGIWNGGQAIVGNPKIGLWEHYVTVFDGYQYILYINGKLIGEEPFETRVKELNIKKPRLFLGGIGLNAYFNGSIDELRIYSRDLDVEEVQNIYNSEKKALGL